MIRKQQQVETINQFEENQVLGQTAMQSAEKDAQVVTAAAATQAIEANKETEALPPAVDGTGRSHFVPNTNPDRMVTVLSADTPYCQLYVKRVSGSDGEGGTIAGESVKIVFGSGVSKLQHKQQVTLVLVNGLQLIGYFTKTKTRKGIYLPKKYLPEGFPLPRLGKLQPIVVAKLIVD